MTTRPRITNPLPIVLLVTIGVLLCATILFTARQPTISQDIPTPAPSSAPNLVLDERLTKRFDHLSAQEREVWKEQANPLAGYRFSYPLELAVRDNGILGATLYPIAALPKIDGKISTNIPLPTNYGYFNVLPNTESGGVRSISPEFDREWELVVGARTASSSAERKRLKPFLDAHTEVEELLKLEVGEKNRFFERQEDTQLNTLKVPTYRSYRPIAGFPAEVIELRYLYTTPTRTYIFGGYTGGKKSTDPTAFTSELLLKILNTLVIQ